MTSTDSGIGAVARRVITVASTIVLHLVSAPVALFSWFLVVYAFQDRVTVAMQVTFVVGFVVIAVLAGLVVGLIATLIASMPILQGLRYGVWSALALYLAALAGGTVVSMANNDQGAVTADQPQAPFVVLVVVAAIAAIVSAALALRTLIRATQPR